MPLTETPPDIILNVINRGQTAAQRNGHSTANKDSSVVETAAVDTAKTLQNGEHAEGKEQEFHISIPGDISRDGVYGIRWLIVDHERVRVISLPDAEPVLEPLLPKRGKAKKQEPRYGGTAVVDLEIPLSEIVESKVENLVGCAALILVTKTGEAHEALRYTLGLGQQFSAAARAIQSYAKGEEPSESLLLGIEKKVCPKCGDPLPDDTNVCNKCVDKRAVLARLLAYAKPYKVQVFLVTLFMLSGTVTQLIPAILMKKLTDDVLVPHRHYAWLFWIVLGNLIFSALSTGITIWRGRISAWISNHMVYTLRTQAYTRLQELSISYYDKRQTGTLLTRVTQDVNELQNFMVDGIQFFLVNSLQILGSLAVMLYYNWKITLIVLIPIPITVICTRMIFRMLWGRWHRLFYLRSSLTSIINSALSGVRVVKAFAQEDKEINRFRDRAHLVFQAGVVVEQSWATYFPLLGFITTIGIFVIWYVGGRQVFLNYSNSSAHGMTIGLLGMFITYFFSMIGPLQGMTRIADWLSRSTASAERVFEVVDTEPEVANISDPIRMEHIEGRVELQNIRFSYDKQRDVLEDVSVEVEPGEMIGLVGHSGAGKSTIINLLSRFYDVKEGAILIDGVDIKNIDINDLRRQVGVVLQEPFLFPGTILENIGYARPGSTPEQIMKAAKAANAHDFIMRFPDGYDTYVGERGARLSGGERQRLSIARAILHDPRILILDEATASVDTETEKQIQDAIGRLIQGRTTFAIAHRLSTLRNANRLMVVEKGKLVELGTHDELLSKPDGVFRKLVDMQQAVNQIREV